MTVTSGSEEITAVKCELAAEVLRSSGKLRLQVTGWSMLPAILPGDTLMIERANGEQISSGDIVLFQRHGRVFAHRVVSKSGHAEDMQIFTQGDGMAWPDPAVSESQLLGKVNFIVRDGRLIEPGNNLGFSQRAVAALVRRSHSAARIVAGIHGRRRSLAKADEPCRS
jgi:signal peptidase I